MTDAAKVKMELRSKKRGAAVKGKTELAVTPDVNVLSLAIRHLDGGRARFVEFVKIAATNGDPSAVSWWTVYADLSASQRKVANFDDVCLTAGVKPFELMRGVVGHGMEAMTDVANLVAAALHPKVVAAAGKSALRIDGEHAAIAAEDRKQLLQARGFLPVPKGASIHLHANASANAQAASVMAQDPSVPKFSSDIAALSQPKAAVQRQLAGDTSDPIIELPVIESVEI